MIIHEARPEAESVALKELKVRIPSRHHIILKSMRMLHGRPISAVVTSALEEYFAAHAGAPAASGPGLARPPAGPSSARDAPPTDAGVRHTHA